ncbi:hypothetical protein EDD29_0031 [Actinocorallia herbida]|uniref:Uncharacterized protein n=1 Tax=Actinocorallia herbida TaxID=58109 RepID=A0A3N1CMK6_9ACTN|nr:hypothetical protein [Actinocorallia herbida]ROO82551.1 hypothetical protein EDD29_0031 [Actinocorallia herbida]
MTKDRDEQLLDEVAEAYALIDPPPEHTIKAARKAFLGEGEVSAGEA